MKNKFDIGKGLSDEIRRQALNQTHDKISGPIFRQTYVEIQHQTYWQIRDQTYGQISRYIEEALDEK